MLKNWGHVKTHTWFGEAVANCRFTRSGAANQFWIWESQPGAQLCSLNARLQAGRGTSLVRWGENKPGHRKRKCMEGKGAFLTAIEQLGRALLRSGKFPNSVILRATGKLEPRGS